MKMNTSEIAKLFQEKKYTQLIYLIETFDGELSAEILNILAISRLSKGQDKETFEIAINEFKKVYLKEKKTETGLNGLINFLNSSADFYDYLGRQDTTNAATNYLKESIFFFKEAEKNFGYEKRLVSVAIRVFKRLNNLDVILHYYKKLFLNEDHTLSTFCSWIFFNNYKYDWEQKDYIYFSKLLEKYSPKTEEEKLHSLSNDSNDKIKLGFLSADINKFHSITYFLKTVLSTYDKKKYEVYLFLNSNTDDDGTKIFKSYVDHTINITDMNDTECINAIRKINLDIMFDLMGVSSTNRISLFINRVAKKQASWLGYCNTLGFKNMDYLIADPNLIYTNEEKLYSEKIINLPEIWNCHTGFNFERIEQPPPYLENKFITFGSFNNYNKINNNVLETWVKILKNVDGSKLILKSSTKKEVDEFQNILKKNCVLDSVIFLPTTKLFKDHMDQYKNIDIALDTFPYNGVTTTFEALWMGVPVITMKGHNFNSRCGESINKNIQMEDLIAKNENDYVLIANNLAKDKEKLLNRRNKLFNNVLSSPLFDKKNFNINFYKLIDDLILNQ